MPDLEVNELAAWIAAGERPSWAKSEADGGQSSE
jgi:hypothetical protein